MSGPSDILRVLKRGPKTNSQLQELTCDHAGSVARYCAGLIARGRIVRIDGKRGRGTRAIYAIAEDHCSGHVARDDNPKVCRHCGTHVDSLRGEQVPA